MIKFSFTTLLSLWVIFSMVFSDVGRAIQPPLFVAQVDIQPAASSTGGTADSAPTGQFPNTISPGAACSFTQGVGPEALPPRTSLVGEVIATASGLGVNTASGALTYEGIGLSIPTQGPELQASLRYNSLYRQADEGWGYGWAFDRDWYYQSETNGDVTIRIGRGGYAFTSDGQGGFIAPSPGITLTQTGDSLLLDLSDGGRLSFDSPVHRHVTRWEDAAGQWLAFTYGADGRLATLANSQGRQLNFSFLNGRLERISDLGSTPVRHLQLSYDLAGDLRSVSDALGHTTTFTYDGEHRLSSLAGPRGELTSLVYEGDYVSQVAEGDTRTAFLVDEQNRTLTVQKSEPGGLPRAWTWTYDYQGMLESVTAPDGTRRSQVWDAVQNQWRSTDENGHSVVFQIQDSQLSEVVDALGNATHYTYQDGLIQGVSSPLGQTTTFGYDEAGNVVEIINPLEQHRLYEYDDHRNLTSLEDPLGRSTGFEYNDAGLTVAITNPLGIASHTSYDAAGNPIAATDGNQHTTFYAYDALGQTTAITDALGASIHLAYDGSGNLISVVDPDYHTTRTGYDLQNRPVVITDTLGGQTQLAYDAWGNPIRLTDAAGHTTLYQYDERDRLVATTDPLSQTLFLAYDGVGNLIATTDAAGQQVGYTYDAANHLTAIDYPGGDDAYYFYDPAGQVVALGDEQIEIRYRYDAGGQIAGAAYLYDGAGFASVVMTYTYSDAGELTGIVLPGGEALGYTYDDASRPILVIGEDIHYELAYDDGDRLTEMAPAAGQPGVRSTYAYNAVNRLTSLSNASSDGMTLFDTFTYAHDPAGNLLSAVHNGDVFTYTYDALDRLTRVDGPGGAWETYTYDEVGNRLSLETPLGEVTYVYDEADQLVSLSDTRSGSTVVTTFTYDPRGNLQTRTSAQEQLVYAWDAAGQLQRIAFPDGSYLAYTYGPNGQRLSRRGRDGAVTFFVYSGYNLIEERDELGNRLAAYTYAPGLDRPLSMQRGGQTFYYRYDRQGSAIGLIDEAGNQVVSYTYDAWGNPLSQDGTLLNPFRYSGREWDADAGLYFLRSRYYDPALGRFVSRDPLGPSDGTNLYGYAAGNPLKYNDPLGTTASPVEDQPQECNGFCKCFNQCFKDMYVGAVSKMISQIKNVYTKILDVTKKLVSPPMSLSSAANKALTEIAKALQRLEKALREAGLIGDTGSDCADMAAMLSREVSTTLLGLAGAITGLTGAALSCTTVVGCIILVVYVKALVGILAASIAQAGSLLASVGACSVSSYSECKDRTDPEISVTQRSCGGVIESYDVVATDNCTLARDPSGFYAAFGEPQTITAEDASGNEVTAEIPACSSSCFTKPTCKCGKEPEWNQEECEWKCPEDEPPDEPDCPACSDPEFNDQSCQWECKERPKPDRPDCGSDQCGRSLQPAWDAENCSWRCQGETNNPCMPDDNRSPANPQASLQAFGSPGPGSSLPQLPAQPESCDSGEASSQWVTNLLVPVGPPLPPAPLELPAAPSDSESWLENLLRPFGPSPSLAQPEAAAEIPAAEALPQASQPVRSVSTSRIAILDNGFSISMKQYLALLGIQADRIRTDFSPEMVARYRVLIIPSGGLSGYRDSQAMRQRLERFVENGGTLLVLAQQHGDLFALLPGGEVGGYGYDEDVNCQADSAYLADFSLALAGLTSEKLSLNIDGFFTHWPQDASVLLGRMANGMPAMLGYPYGAGQVVVTTAYADMAYYQGQGTGHEKTLLRGLVYWAETPSLYTDRYGPRDLVTATLTLTNQTAEAVVALQYEWLDPQHRPAGSQTIPLTTSLEPGASVSLTLTLDLNALPLPLADRYGLWMLNASLLSDTGRNVQALPAAYGFGVTRFTGQAGGGHAYPGGLYAVSVTSESERYVYGAPAHFTYHFFNYSDQPHTFSVSWLMIHHSWYGVPGYSGSRAVVVPAHSTLAVTEALERVVDLDRLRVHLSVDGRATSYIEKGFWVIHNPLRQSLWTEKFSYQLGASPNFVVTTSSSVRLASTFEAGSTFILYDPRGQAIYTDTQTVEVVPGVAPTYTLTLPPLALPGLYKVRLRGTAFDGKIENFSNFKVNLPQAQLHLAIPSILRPGEPITVTVSNPNTFLLPETTLQTQLRDSHGQIVWSDTRVVDALALESTRLIPVSLGSLDGIEYADYFLETSLLFYGNILARTALRLPASVSSSLVFDHSPYRVGEMAIVTATLTNQGYFDLEPTLAFSVPDIGFQAVLTPALAARTATSVPVTFTLPVTLAAGQHALDFSLVQGNRLARQATFVIPPAAIDARFSSKLVIAGETLPVTLTNTGGEGTDILYNLNLQGLYATQWLPLASETEGLSLTVGASATITMTFPITLASGQYFLNLSGRHLADSRTFATGWSLDVSGADVQAQAGAGPYVAGGELPISLVNHGSVDATVVYRLTLRDSASQFSLGEEWDGILVPAHSTVVISGTLPVGLRSGGYGLHLEGSYTPGDRPVDLVRYVDVQGPVIDLTARTDLPQYLTVDPITVTAQVTNTGTWLPDGELTLSIVQVEAEGQAWETYTTANSDLSYNTVGAVHVDDLGRTWLGTTDGWYGPPVLDRLDTDRVTWQSFPLPAALSCSSTINQIAHDFENRIWVATNCGLGILAADGSSWTTYKSASSDLLSDQVNALALDGNGDAWIGTSSGVNHLTSYGYWESFTQSDSGLLSDWVYAVAVDAEDHIWFGTSAGLNKFIPSVPSLMSGLDFAAIGDAWVAYTTENSPLLRDTIYDIAFDQDENVWLATPGWGEDSGISVLLANGEWMTYTVANSGLVSGYTTAIAVDTNNQKWIGYETQGISLLSSDNLSWEHLSFPEISDNAVNATYAAPNGDVWLATEPWSGSGGATRGHVSPLRERVLWTYQTDLSLDSPGTFFDLDTLAAEALDATGRFTLRGVLVSLTGQELARDEYPFYVFPTQVGLTLESDQAIYRPGQRLQASGALINHSSLVLSDQVITVTLGEETLYMAGPVDLAPGEVFSYSVVADAPLAEGFYLLEARSPQAVAQHLIQVLAPFGSAVLDAPAIAGQAPFSATLTVTNTALTEAIVQVQVGGTEPEWLAIPPGSAAQVRRSVAIQGTTLLTATVTGDLEFSLQREIHWGERALIGLEMPAPALPAGPLAVTYALTNTGSLAFSVPYTLTLDGEALKAGHAWLYPGQSLDGVLLLDLAAGTHSLAASVGDGYDVYALDVYDQGEYRVNITRLEVPDVWAGPISITAGLENNGHTPVDGILAVETAFGGGYIPFALEPGEVQSVTITLDSAAAPASGTYTLTATVRANGEILDEETVVGNIPAPALSVHLPALILTPGEETFWPFGVHNPGGVGVPFTFTLDLPGLYADEQTGWIGPGQTITATFAFTVPADIEARTETGFYTLAEERTAFLYSVAGYELDMSASLSSFAVSPGEWITASFQITDVSGLGEPVPLLLRLTGLDDPLTATLTLTDTAAVRFSFAAPAQSTLLSYGLYAPEGRSLLLDTLRLYVDGDPLSLSPLQPRYLPGDTVEVVAATTVTGTLSWNALGTAGTLSLVPGVPEHFSFPLPGDLGEDTYRLTYYFEMAQGEWRQGEMLFDVDGNRVEVHRTELERYELGAQELVTATLQINTQQALDGVTIFATLLAPDGSPLANSATTLDLPAGQMWVTLPGMFFAPDQAGLYRFSYRLARATRELASGWQGLEIDGPLVMGVSLPHAYYLPTQPVTASVTLLNQGELPALLAVNVNGQLVEERPITTAGYQVENFDLGLWPVGVYTLTATLYDAAGWSGQASARLDVLEPGVQLLVAPPNGHNGWYRTLPDLSLWPTITESTLEYRWDGGPAYVSPDGRVTMPPDGQHELAVWARMPDGVAGEVVTHTLKWDRTAPQIEASIEVGTPVTVSLVVSDALSGAGWLAYWEQGAWVTYTAPLAFTSAQTQTLFYQAYDQAGNGGGVALLQVPPVTHPYALALDAGGDTGQDAPGTSMMYTLHLTNTGFAADTYTVTLTGNLWPVQAPASLGPLQAGQDAVWPVVVDIPAGVTLGEGDDLQVTVISQGDPLQSAQQALTTTASLFYGVQVESGRNGRSAAPGGQASYRLRLTNRGNAVDTFSWSLSGNAWPVTAPAQAGPLNPGEYIDVDVVVAVPADAQDGEQDVVDLTVTSLSDPAQHEEIHLTTTASSPSGIYAFQLQPSMNTQAGSPGQTVVYTLWLTNTGTLQNTIDLTVEGQEWTTWLSLARVSLAPGEVRAVQVYVTIPESVSLGASDQVSVKAEGSGTSTAQVTFTTSARPYQIYLPLVLR